MSASLASCTVPPLKIMRMTQMVVGTLSYCFLYLFWHCSSVCVYEFILFLALRFGVSISRVLFDMCEEYEKHKASLGMKVSDMTRDSVLSK